jgi:hypothetical protein
VAGGFCRLVTSAASYGSVCRLVTSAASYGRAKQVIMLPRFHTPKEYRRPDAIRLMLSQTLGWPHGVDSAAREQACGSLGGMVASLLLLSKRLLPPFPHHGCDSLGEMVAMATELEPNENQDKTLVLQEKMQVRVLGLEPRTHGLKVRCSTD